MTNIIGANGGKTHLAADWADNLPLFPNCRTGASTNSNTTTYFETKTPIDCIRCGMAAAYRAEKAAAELAAQVELAEVDADAAPETAEPTACLRCHRTLRSAHSIARGYGRTCRAKVTAAAKAKAAASAFKPATVAKAMELIEIGGLVAIRPKVFRVVRSDGTGTYLTAPEACTCKAGLRGLHVCYHRAAATILLAA
jgi:hypothetical protein